MMAFTRIHTRTKWNWLPWPAERALHLLPHPAAVVVVVVVVAVVSSSRWGGRRHRAEWRKEVPWPLGRGP